MRKACLRKICLGALLGLALSGPVAAQDRDFSKVEIKATLVAGKIHMLEGAGGNIGVSVGSDGLLIVDDQFAPLADKIRAALKGLGKGDLAFVLNTHWHFDHTGGNESFGPEATIIAHDNVRKRMEKGQTIFGDVIPPAAPKALPVITFGESVSLHFNGEEIRMLHYPHGHTDGDSVIFFTGSNVVHMGDDYFAGRFPFIDIESGGSLAGLTENVEKILGQLPADVKIIPGHGPLSTKADLQGYLAMLKETTAHVRQRIEAGKDLKAIQAEGLPEKWKEWGSGFITTEDRIALIHGSLTNKASGSGSGTHHH
ncbi:MAG TPA: MBL fold metallo-hydrolase [Thermoanaerobaculia bacterium]|nr:MBL fold metallo-hydrolase [Thermoanaerobaculia bacterium]